MSSDSIASIPTSSASPRLPHEVLEHIIFLTSEHRPSLATFSLVCRAWLPASRFHFFRGSRVLLSPRNIGKLRSLMRSPHATLTRYIRHLVIRLERPLMSTNPGGPAIPDDVRLLPPFPSIQTLEIEERTCFYFASLSSRALAKTFPTLTGLRLAYCTFDTFNDVVALVSSFPLLSHLDISSINWIKPDVAHSARGSRLSLLSLAIQYGPIEEWFAWLMSLDSPPPLRTLRLGFQMWPVTVNVYAPSLDPFLRQLGPTLEDLHIDENATPSIKNVDISHNTQLRTIHIDFAVHWDHPTSFEWVHRMLATTRTASIQTLTFQGYSYDRISIFDPILYLQELDQLLSEPQFSNLHQVRFFRNSATTSLIDVIRKQMPFCHSRGILFLSQPPPESPGHLFLRYRLAP